MSRSKENLANGKPIATTSKPKSQKDCCCIRDYNQLKNNLRTMQAATRPTVETQSKPRKAKSKIASDEQRCGTPPEPLRSNAKTWFQVLQESPKKGAAKVSNIDDRHQRFHSRTNLFENIDPRGLNLLLDDEKFLKTLIRMNEIIQFECEETRKTSRPHPDVSITDDDKFKSYMGKKLQEESLEQKEKQNLQAKALVKLLQNMQAVSENSEVQRETLDNLTRQVAQLREENKMLDKLKEIRIDLESKLASITTENHYLKKQLYTAEAERDKVSGLLEAKEREINVLRRHITDIKGKIAQKIDSGIKFEIDDPAIEFNFDDTIASVPETHESFGMPIRPASSSPTEEVLRKWKNRSFIDRPEDSGIQSNPRETGQSPDGHRAETSIRKQVLTDLRNNVKKTMEEFQLDMQLNDGSLNLSDATYKFSSSSIT